LVHEVALGSWGLSGPFSLAVGVAEKGNSYGEREKWGSGGTTEEKAFTSERRWVQKSGVEKDRDPIAGSPTSNKRGRQ